MLVLPPHAISWTHDGKVEDVNACDVDLTRRGSGRHRGGRLTIFNGRNRLGFRNRDAPSTAATCGSASRRFRSLTSIVQVILTGENIRKTLALTAPRDRTQQQRETLCTARQPVTCSGLHYNNCTNIHTRTRHTPQRRLLQERTQSARTIDAPAAHSHHSHRTMQPDTPAEPTHKHAPYSHTTLFCVGLRRRLRCVHGVWIGDGRHWR